MDIFGSIAYVFRYIGEQGDDIVVCHLFDFMDPIQFKISLGLDVMKSIIRDNTNLFMASQARISTLTMVRSSFSSVQMDPISLPV